MWRALIAVLTLTACTAAQQDQLAQDAAKQAIRPVLQQRYPGIPVESATDCIIESATASEILVLAADAATGPTASTVEMVVRIATRPEAVTCLAEAALILGTTG